jgi:hypothetical protein
VIPHGVAVDALGGDPIAATPLNGVIQAKDDHTRRDEHRYYEPEQQPTGG